MDKDFWRVVNELVNTSKIAIDRPKGTSHPRYPDMIYPVDYGYLEDTASMDGDGVDVWIGTDEAQQIDSMICIVDLVKRDSEVKILIGCTEEEKTEILNWHNRTENMKGILIRRKQV